MEIPRGGPWARRWPLLRGETGAEPFSPPESREKANRADLRLRERRVERREVVEDTRRRYSELADLPPGLPSRGHK